MNAHWIPAMTFAAGLYGALALVPSAPPERDTTFVGSDQINEAIVSVRRGATWQTCDKRAYPVGSRCGKEAWAQVTSYAGYAGREGRKCVWLHPQGRGAVTRVRWPSVELGSHVSLRASLLDGSGARGDAKVTLSSGGKEWGRLSVDDPWDRPSLTVEVPPGPPRAELVLEARAQDNTWRKLCVELTMRGKRRPGGKRRGAAR